MTIPHDTIASAHALQLEAYRHMSGAERVQIAWRLSLAAREAAMAGIRRRHPEYSGEQVRQALFRLLLGEQLTRNVWPDREPVDP